MENDFGKLVQHYREKAGFTQEELAAKLEVSQQTVAKWESGKAYPRPAAFAKLNHVLLISSAKIMELYSKSKGARSGKVTFPDLSSKPRLEEDQNGLRWNSGIDNDPVRAAIEEVRPLLADRKNCAWYQGITGGSLSWFVHYSDDDIVVNISYAVSPRALHEILKSGMHKILWKLATLRAHLKDKRNYLAIIIMPGHVGMDSEDGKDDGYLPNEIVMRRFTAEAALLDISIFVANNPRQLQALMTVYEPEDDFLA